MPFQCSKFKNKSFPDEEKSKNVAREYKTISSILEHCNMMDERLTSQKLIEAWHGKGPPKLRPPGLNPTTLTRENSERIVALLLLENYLIEEFHFTPYSTISYINTGECVLVCLGLESCLSWQEKIGGLFLLENYLVEEFYFMPYSTISCITLFLVFHGKRKLVGFFFWRTS